MRYTCRGVAGSLQVAQLTRLLLSGPGLLYPLFTFTTTPLHSDLLVPPIDQYDRPLGHDPTWEDKKHDKVVWRGSTTGAALDIEHMRKWSQRPRLCRCAFSRSVSFLFSPSLTPRIRSQCPTRWAPRLSRSHRTTNRGNLVLLRKSQGMRRSSLLPGSTSSSSASPSNALIPSHARRSQR